MFRFPWLGGCSTGPRVGPLGLHRKCLARVLVCSGARVVLSSAWRSLPGGLVFLGYDFHAETIHTGIVSECLLLPGYPWWFWYCNLMATVVWHVSVNFIHQFLLHIANCNSLNSASDAWEACRLWIGCCRNGACRRSTLARLVKEQIEARQILHKLRK